MNVAEDRAKHHYQAALVTDPVNAFEVFGMSLFSAFCFITGGWFSNPTEPRHRVELRRLRSREILVSVAQERRVKKAQLVLDQLQRDLSSMSPDDFRELYDFEDQ